MSGEEATLELARAILAEDNRMIYRYDYEYSFKHCRSTQCLLCQFRSMCTNYYSVPSIRVGSEVYKTLTDEQPELFL